MSKDGNKVGEKSKPTTKWVTCLKTPRISRVLYLLELFPDGLFQRDIFELLDAKKDTGIQLALKELEGTNLIQNEIRIGKNIHVNVDGKGFQGIRIGSDAKRKKYFITESPIETFFNNILITLGPLQEIEIEKIKQLMMETWNNRLRQVEFSRKYFITHLKRQERHAAKGMRILAKKMKKKNNHEEAAYFQEQVEGINQLKQMEIKAKERMQKTEMERLRRRDYDFNYVNYISTELQNILLNTLLSAYSDIQNRREANFDEKTIQTINNILHVIYSEKRDQIMLERVLHRLNHFDQEIKIKESKDLLENSDFGNN